MAELRALIETPDSPWPAMVANDVLDQCDAFSDRYSELFFDRNIDHVELFKWAHTCLAVHTSDEGIVVFDPTIRQFYPEYPMPYFLGPAPMLSNLIETHGGWHASIDPDPGVADFITARDAYWEAQVAHCMLQHVGYNPLARARYQQEWVDALRAICAGDRDPSWAARVTQPARSSNDVSP
jgi:hypothetical protein